MKFQISFDIPDLKKSIDIAQKISDYVDIMEVGTILLYKYGIHSIEQFRKHFPQKTILADTKIVDRGNDITSVIAKANPDWLTVMAGTSSNVIHTVTKSAHKINKKVMLDLLDSKSPGQSAMEAQGLGIDAILFHSPYDESTSAVFLDKWEMVKGNTSLPIFISANINRNTITQIIKLDPDGIIIGKSIIEAENPGEEANYFYKSIHRKE